MNKNDMPDQLKSTIRHGLTGIGGVLVGQGVIEEASLEGAVGAVLFLIGLGWSYFKNRSKN